MFNEQTGTIEFPQPRNIVFDALIHTVARLPKFSISFADPLGGRVTVKSGMTLLSWGETIPMTLHDTPSGGTLVRIVSALNFGLVDWGKNRQNIEVIMNNLALNLRAQAPAAARFCTHCGQALTGPARFCPQCGQGVSA